MTPAIIKVENVAKRYRINTLRDQDTLAGQILSLGRSLLPGNPPDTNSKQDYVWALRDISFEIQPGEIVGIIGKNGSGKSTLLKLLSRIVRPTQGRIELRGRVASLLEVGTGFHPELSGRENVYMNAAILGMSRAEIRRKFDEIVDFAEVGRFIDTPVKRYSSGMHTRLAFAVAAHLEPDILLVDEVLAVGDAAFQQKSLGKMNEVSQQGRTVLFVSHNMATITGLCERCILLAHGEKIDDGPTRPVVEQYMQVNTAIAGVIQWDDLASAPGSERIKLRRVRLFNNDLVTADVDISKETIIELDYENLEPGSKMLASILLKDHLGTEVLASSNLTSANLGHDEWFNRPAPVGRYRTTCVIPANFLNEGRYNIQVTVQTDINRVEVLLTDALTFTVHESGEMRREFTGKWPGVVRPKLPWQTVYLNEETIEDTL